MSRLIYPNRLRVAILLLGVVDRADMRRLLWFAWMHDTDTDYKSHRLTIVRGLKGLRRIQIAFAAGLYEYLVVKLPLVVGGLSLIALYIVMKLIYYVMLWVK